MFQYFREAIDDKGMLLAGRFGHTTTINTFFTLLGLNHDSSPLTSSNYDVMVDRKWRTSLNAPMGSNIAFILYRCNDLPSYRLKTFINEKPILLPACEEYVCDLDDIMSTWRPIADNCDVEKICKWNEDGSEFQNSSVKCSHYAYYIVVSISIAYVIALLQD